MTYQEAVNYIESQLRFGMKPGFERINGLLDLLGHPEKDLRYVHVAGTNGKGSVCTEVANILQAAGYRVGLFTSPYVVTFRERIRVDGKYIDPVLMGQLTEQVKAAADELAKQDILPTEFEIITALAFLYFQQTACNIVVLEVGLGGLLDSTNIIESPLVCGITSLSMDHTAILGSTLPEIAAQKAGIMKPGVPVITAERQAPEAMAVLEQTAAEKGCALSIGSTESIQILSTSIYGTELKLDGLKVRLPLIGSHQIQNLGVTLGIIHVLRERGFYIGARHVKAGLEFSVIPARLEVLRKDPLILLDGGHNAGGIQALSDALSAYTESGSRVFLMGVMADKDVDRMICELAPLANLIVTTTPGNPRAMTAEELRHHLLDAGFPAKKLVAVSQPEEAFDKALSLAGKNPLIVCGSLYLAGDVRQHILEVLEEAEA